MVVLQWKATLSIERRRLFKKVLIVFKLFPKYKFTTNHKRSFLNWQLLSISMCYKYPTMLFKISILLKIRSLLHCIDMRRRLYVKSREWICVSWWKGLLQWKDWALEDGIQSCKRGPKQLLINEILHMCLKNVFSKSKKAIFQIFKHKYDIKQTFRTRKRRGYN